MNKSLPLNFSLLLSLTILLMSGCGQAKGPVRAAAKGTVTLKGEPLSNAVIRFIPIGETHGPKVSASVESGSFQFPKHAGPVLGTHRVEIESIEANLPDPDDADAVREYQKTLKKRRPNSVKIPAKYNRDSQLQEQVTETGTNEFRFELGS